MDLDAYVAAHVDGWRRLEELARKRRLSGAESDELVERYQQVATHLSVVRTSAPDATGVAYLSSLLSRARSRASGTRTSTWGGVRRFFLERFPAALYRLRWWWLGTLAANVALTAVMMWWLLDHPAVEQTLLSPEEVRQLVDHDFEDYYSEYAASHFAAQVWVNNAWVAALCLALGVLGLPVVFLLFQNMANLAIIGSIMIRHDHGGHFWGLLLPHGLLELTAVFVAGGVGLRVGAGRPKQLIEVGGRPLLAYPVETFASSARLDRVIVVMASGCLGLITFPRLRGDRRQPSRQR